MDNKFTTFKKLKSVILDLGVGLLEKTEQRSKQLYRGVIIGGKEDLVIANRGLFEILPDGSVIRVIIHAPQGPYPGKQDIYYLDDPFEGWHKFHIYWCQAVQQWSNRLRKTNRNDGSFYYPVYQSDGRQHKPELTEGGRKLHLCHHCLTIAHNTGIEGEVDDFDVHRFLTLQPEIDDFTSIGHATDYDRIPNVYAAEWPQISKEFKSKRNWTCERCRINLEDHKHYLHAHHRNERKYDNSLFNLEALCIRCHAAEHPNNSMLHGKELQNFKQLFPG